MLTARTIDTMTDHAPLTDADYEALADSYQAMPPTAEEILGPVEVAPQLAPEVEVEE